MIAGGGEGIPRENLTAEHGEKNRLAILVILLALVIWFLSTASFFLFCNFRFVMAVAFVLSVDRSSILPGSLAHVRGRIAASIV